MLRIYLTKGKNLYILLQSYFYVVFIFFTDGIIVDQMIRTILCISC